MGFGSSGGAEDADTFFGAVGIEDFIGVAHFFKGSAHELELSEVEAVSCHF